MLVSAVKKATCQSEWPVFSVNFFTVLGKAETLLLPRTCTVTYTCSSLMYFPCSSVFFLPLLQFVFLPFTDISSLPPVFPFTHSSALSMPSIRSGLSAGISHFPAPARGEAGPTSTSALREEGGPATGRERGQTRSETGLPARLRHPQMYDTIVLCEFARLVSAAEVHEVHVEPHTLPGEDGLMVKPTVWGNLICDTRLLTLQTSPTSYKAAALSL